MRPEFEAFQKIHRIKRNCVITEKLDGTNAQVCITDDGEVYAGSRNRWITPEADNYGFAAWARDNEAALRSLGPGRHFGEWWGAGIQRCYGLTEKRFSLFNVGRWSAPDSGLPACCHLVPVLYEGEFSTVMVDMVAERLRSAGSVAAPGFMNPEGLVVYMSAGRTLHKYTLDGDGHKGMPDVARVA